MGGGEGGHVREIELKRSRGEVSCAECRRCDIKCDKKLPCSSCQRRGCASLCPNGKYCTFLLFGLFDSLSFPGFWRSMICFYLLQASSCPYPNLRFISL
ncbi:hypothetical protein BD410DRAFT_731988 [Rickenella mellea]|uniref:Zn(2)-C6 fungal-type domain-containing protein n=1 Tax=Rickenella mellea TaxID=50990 RepID=A0A4Y7PM13_9AGAM|nr:hypothetical protein BD410DRAFT_731988 [Rickenella mellea]